MGGAPVTSPRTSIGYTATFARLQASIVAVTSEIWSSRTRNPAVSSTSVLRPGTVLSVFARLRSARIMSCTAKSFAARDSCGMVVDAGSFGATAENLMPFTTLFSRSAFSVKFCATCSDPPKFTIEIRWFGPALVSMNLAAAARACTWSPGFIVELSKNNTR
jgi:hypothetical protein